MKIIVEIDSPNAKTVGEVRNHQMNTKDAKNEKSYSELLQDIRASHCNLYGHTPASVVVQRENIIQYFEDKILGLAKEGKDTVFLQGLMSSVTGDLLAVTSNYCKGNISNIKNYYR
jgi:hypothetical protein